MSDLQHEISNLLCANSRRGGAMLKMLVFCDLKSHIMLWADSPEIAAFAWNSLQAHDFDFASPTPVLTHIVSTSWP